MQKTCIIIPCFNEEFRLPVDEIQNFIRNPEYNQIHLCFVNDGSNDNTLKVISEIARLDENRISIVDLKKNSGKAEAVRKGIIAALSDKSFYAIGYFDADMATPLKEVIHLWNYLEKDETYMAVIGSRIKRLGAQIIRSDRRHYLGRIFATITGIFLKIPVYDTQCGAKLFKAELLEKIIMEPFISRWLFDVEIFARIIKLVGRQKAESIFIEAPLNQWIEKSKSKISFWFFMKAPFELFKIFRYYSI